MSTPTVNVTLNSLDTEGYQVDTDNIDLTYNQISDIVDHATQLIVVLRDVAAKHGGIEIFRQVLSELEESLETAGVIHEDDNPLPVLHLQRGKGAIKCNDAEHATILAALRFYQQKGMGDPHNRSDDIQAIACQTEDSTSLDAAGIDDLCEHLN